MAVPSAMAKLFADELRIWASMLRRAENDYEREYARRQIAGAESRLADLVADKYERELCSEAVKSPETRAEADTNSETFSKRDMATSARAR